MHGFAHSLAWNVAPLRTTHPRTKINSLPVTPGRNSLKAPRQASIFGLSNTGADRSIVGGEGSDEPDYPNLGPYELSDSPLFTYLSKYAYTNQASRPS